MRVRLLHLSIFSYNSMLVHFTHYVAFEVYFICHLIVVNFGIQSFASMGYFDTIFTLQLHLSFFCS